MELSGQQGNRELVNDAKIGVRRPSQIGKFAHFRVSRVKLNCRETHQKIFLHQNGDQGCNVGGGRRGGAVGVVHGRTPI